MGRLIKTLFGGIFSLIRNLFSLGKKKPTAGSESSGASEVKASKVTAPKVKAPEPTTFFLAADEARGFTAASSAKTSAKAAVAPALNLPAVTIGTASSDSSRRRPGANMNAYLAMARQVKTS
jgi:hypothetical protein